MGVRGEGGGENRTGFLKTLCREAGATAVWGCGEKGVDWAGLTHVVYEPEGEDEEGANKTRITIHTGLESEEEKKRLNAQVQRVPLSYVASLLTKPVRPDRVEACAADQGVGPISKLVNFTRFRSQVLFK